MTLPSSPPVSATVPFPRPSGVHFCVPSRGALCIRKPNTHHANIVKMHIFKSNFI